MSARVVIGMRPAARSIRRLAILFLSASTLAIPPHAAAQDCLRLPAGLGSVADTPDTCFLGAGLVPRTTCRQVDVLCEGLPRIRAALRITEPAPSATPLGTVVLGTGGPGIDFVSRFPEGRALIESLSVEGFRVVDRSWATEWFASRVGFRSQSCRYATLITWIHDTIHTEGAFCVSGNSAGSMEIAYALGTWNRGEIIDVAVPTGGPPTARLDFGCPEELSPSWIALCEEIIPDSGAACDPVCSLRDEDIACDQCGPSPSLAALRFDSILYDGALLDYPATSVHFLFGVLDCGAAVPQGLLYAGAVASEKTVEFLPDAPHRVWATEDGRKALVRTLVDGAIAALENDGCDPEGEGDAPAALRLTAAPNPARDVVRFRFTRPCGEEASLVIYDPSGRLVRALEAGPPPEDGAEETLTWDGRDAEGDPVPAGRYLARLLSRGGSADRAVVLVR